jgi:hypothetical protein
VDVVAVFVGKENVLFTNKPNCHVKLAILK